eukprot:3886300-Rhodomonas_salina.1
MLPIDLPGALDLSALPTQPLMAGGGGRRAVLAYPATRMLCAVRFAAMLGTDRARRSVICYTAMVRTWRMVLQVPRDSNPSVRRMYLLQKGTVQLSVLMMSEGYARPVLPSLKTIPLPMHSLVNVRYCERILRLRSPFAMSGNDLAYGAPRPKRKSSHPGSRRPTHVIRDVQY